VHFGGLGGDGSTGGRRCETGESDTTRSGLAVTATSPRHRQRAMEIQSLFLLHI
jgi:hypothetical protein